MKKIKEYLAKWLRKWADILNPEIQFPDLANSIRLYESLFEVQTIKCRYKYPKELSDIPGFEKLHIYDISNGLARTLVEGNFLKISKRIEGNNIAITAEIKALKPNEHETDY